MILQSCMGRLLFPGLLILAQLPVCKPANSSGVATTLDALSLSLHDPHHALEQWVRLHGVHAPKLRLQQVPGRGRGLVATQDIEAGELC